MTLLKLLGKVVVFAVVAVLALTIVGKVRQRATAAGGSAAAEKRGPSAADDKLSDAGFFLLSREEAKNPNVIIMSPPNCPSDEAARARMLAGSLGAAGIPTEFRQEIGGNLDTPEDAARVNKYMNGIAGPVVIVRGWAKGSPTADDVIAQYRNGR